MNDLLKNKMNRDGFSLTSIDLFAGPGGLATGFKWAGILPLIAVEWTDTTVKTYSQNHNADILELNRYPELIYISSCFLSVVIFPVVLSSGSSFLQVFFSSRLSFPLVLLAVFLSGLHGRLSL